MALVKPKQYDWKDSNLALFDSATDKEIKKSSAEKEPAWKKAGLKPGIQIWRIVKFQVIQWPEKDYGKCFDGDSYIILNASIIFVL
ncbi:gelsolin-like protein 2 [Mytilus californianus]|uniref:gelsolin-like protein 2 n=1 Tax=Mytilus californianus TaxID=6549 RepID=UPI00224695AA|nr:gelsolin-like protein 2 [Mytilus californianus]